MLAAAALAGLLSGCTPGFKYLGQGPVGNPPDGPGRTTGRVVSAAPAGRVPPESVPPYFLELDGPAGTAVPNGVPQQLDVTVRASFSGQVLATVRAPGNPGTFTFASASTGDGRTFLVGAQPWKPVSPGGDNTPQPVWFYLLRFDPASGRARLTPVPVPAAPLDEGTPVFISAALSPDGTRLAVAEAGNGNVLHVHVYPLPAGGPGQAWTVAGRITSDVWGASLSWSANDRVLAVGLAFGTVRLLDTAAPPGRAVEDIILGVKDGYWCYYPVLMTSDGSSLVCGVAADYYYREAGGSIPGRGGFAVYDIRTGDLTAMLGAEGTGQSAGGRTPVLIWASPRGTILIGRPLLGQVGQVSLLSNGHYRSIAWTGVQQADPAAEPASAGLPGVP